MTTDIAFTLHGPAEPQCALVLDSPHSGSEFPADFGSVLSEFDLREGEDCFVDELWLPVTELCVGLMAASAPRTYIDVNRHAGDIDLAVLEGGHWPGELVPSGKARTGKSLIWRSLDDGRPIYDRLLSVAEVQRRIDRFHAPYHRALADRIDATHARYGASWHIDCHSMNAIGGAQAEDGAGQARAEFVLGDRDGTSCEPAFTEFVRGALASFGYEVKVNDPFKGAELVRAYADPAKRRHSLQLEINKRLYMVEATREKSAGFEPLQKNLKLLAAAVLEYTQSASRAP